MRPKRFRAIRIQARSAIPALQFAARERSRHPYARAPADGIGAARSPLRRAKFSTSARRGAAGAVSWLRRMPTFMSRPVKSHQCGGPSCGRSAGLRGAPWRHLDRPVCEHPARRPERLTPGGGQPGEAGAKAGGRGARAMAGGREAGARSPKNRLKGIRAAREPASAASRCGSCETPIVAPPGGIGPVGG